jgi:hypothetical protein
MNIFITVKTHYRVTSIVNCSTAKELKKIIVENSSGCHVSKKTMIILLLFMPYGSGLESISLYLEITQAPNHLIIDTVTDFLKASLGVLASALCNNSGYVILTDV